MIAPDGTLVEQVPTGDRMTTNIAFGGPELKTAYITLSIKGELVAMDWPRGGLPLELLEQVNQRRHCERSEAIQLPLLGKKAWIASSLRSSQ